MIITSALLVLIAAGLLATAVHTGHEAGWVNSLQGQALDLSWLVVPGTINRIVVALLRFVPQSLLLAVMEKRQAKRLAREA